MSKHFRDLQSHRANILSIYRSLYCNLRRQTNISYSLRSDIHRLVRSEFSQAKGIMSAWMIRERINRLYELNEKIVDGDVQFFANMIMESQKPPAEPDRRPEPQHPVQDNRRLKELSHLQLYIAKRQKRGELPLNITKEIKEKLLLPLSKHEQWMRNYHKLEYLVAKGPYQIKQNYANVNWGKFSFVRGPWNPSEAQGAWLRNTKNSSQHAISLIQSLTSWREYSVMEDRWEQMTKTALEDEKWVCSIDEAIKFVSNKQKRQIEKINDYRDNKLPAKAQAWQAECQKLYEKRVVKLQRLQKQIPSITPFTHQRGLGFRSPQS